MEGVISVSYLTSKMTRSWDHVHLTEPLEPENINWFLLLLFLFFKSINVLPQLNLDNKTSKCVIKKKNLKIRKLDDRLITRKEKFLCHPYITMIQCPKIGLVCRGLVSQKTGKREPLLLFSGNELCLQVKTQ